MFSNRVAWRLKKAAWEILIASSDLDTRRDLARILHAQGCAPFYARDIEEGLWLMSEQSIGLVFCDCHLEDGTYRDFLIAQRALKKKPRVVVTSLEADWNQYLQSMRLGAFDMITAPLRPTDVESMLIQASHEERNRLRLVALEAQDGDARAAVGG